MISIINLNWKNIRVDPSISSSPDELPAQIEKEFPMNSFVHIDYSLQHPGVVRAGRAAALLRAVWHQARRGSLLLAAVVSALLVVVDQLIDTWSDGHLLAAWVLMWAIAFGAMAFLAAPVGQLGQGLVEGLRRWNAARIKAAQEQRLWETALADPRVMADIRCAMTRAAGGIQRAD
jgi:hypothetical protein